MLGKLICETILLNLGSLSPVLITRLPDKKFPNKFAPKVPYNIPREIHPCFFLFSAVLVTPFIDTLQSLRDLTNFLKPCISLFDITSDVFPGPKIFIQILPSDTDAAAVNPNCTNTLLFNIVSTSSLMTGNYQVIHAAILFWIDKSLKILYPVMNYS